MTEALGQVNRLLHEAAETHHRVCRIVDGADDNSSPDALKREQP